MTDRTDTSKISLMRGTWLVSSTAATVMERTVFPLWGRDWDLLPGVFAPTQCASTAFFTDALPFPVGGSFLEVGCGAGLTAVRAAESGCARVVATDISPVALANSALNVRRHGVSDRVHLGLADVFDPVDDQEGNAGVDADEQFDLVYWNSPFMDPGVTSTGSPDHVRALLQRSVFDPGYRLHARFLGGARNRLREGGRLLLGFSDLGNWEILTVLAEREGYSPIVVKDSGELVDGIRYQLLELVSAEKGLA